MHVAAVFAGIEFRARTLTLLLQAGANPLIKNRNGMTARKLMERSNAHDWAGIGLLRNEKAKAQLTYLQSRVKPDSTSRRPMRWRQLGRSSGEGCLCGIGGWIGWSLTSLLPP